MTATRQRRLAVLGAIALTGLFVAANIHLVTVAVRSQNGCVTPTPGKPPATRAC